MISRMKYAKNVRVGSPAGMHLGTQKKGPTPPPHLAKGGQLVRVRAKGPNASAEGAKPYLGGPGACPPGKYWEKGA